MRWLVVGCGSIGKRHLRNLRHLGETDLLVSRSSRVQVAAIEQEFGVRSFFSLDEALNERPDVVIIANPTSLHLPVAVQCAQAGCHLLLEKPVSHTLDDVAPLQHLVEQHKLTAMVGYNLRFHRVLQTVKTLLEREAVGTIVSVRAWSGQYLPDWHPGEDYRQSYMAHVDLGGGIILTMSHELDYLYWFFGRVAQIVAVTSHPPTLEMATESLAEITLIFQHDLVAQVHLDCLQRVPSRGCEIIGSDGTIHCDINRATVSLHRPGGDATTILQKHSYDNNEPYLAELNHLRECIQSGQSPLIPLGEGIDVLALALAAHRSAATGTRQTCEQHLTHIRTWSG